MLVNIMNAGRVAPFDFPVDQSKPTTEQINLLCSMISVVRISKFFVQDKDPLADNYVAESEVGNIWMRLAVHGMKQRYPPVVSAHIHSPLFAYDEPAIILAEEYQFFNAGWSRNKPKYHCNYAKGDYKEGQDTSTKMQSWTDLTRRQFSRAHKLDYQFGLDSFRLEQYSRLLRVIGDFSTSSACKGQAKYKDRS